MIDANQRIDGPVTFTADGKAVAYTVRDRGADNIWVQLLDGSPGHQITHFTSGEIAGSGQAGFGWSPDGKTLAVLHPHTSSDIVLLRVQKP